MAPLVTISPTIGEEFTILAFVIVVLGGLGNVVGAMVGGLLIGLVQTRLALPARAGPLLSVFVVFVLSLFLRPQGIFGRTSMSTADARSAGDAPAAAAATGLGPPPPRPRRLRGRADADAARADARGESIAVRTLIFAILAVGWNLMSGYGGMFSFGHAAFFGIGAYTDAYLRRRARRSRPGSRWPSGR